MYSDEVVVIGSSPTLAYCTIFIVMPSEVVDLHICICIVPVPFCTCVRTGFVPQLHCRSLLRRRRPSFPAVLTCFHLFATVWREVTWAPLCSNWGHDFSTLFKSDVVESGSTVLRILERSRAWSSWVCAVGDTTDEEGWVDLLWCSPHCDTADSGLMNDTLATFSSSSDCCDDPTVLWCQQSIPSVSSTTQLLRVCCSALAANH